jgi:hypothetical protein
MPNDNIKKEQSAGILLLKDLIYGKIGGLGKTSWLSSCKYL